MCSNGCFIITFPRKLISQHLIYSLVGIGVLFPQENGYTEMDRSCDEVLSGVLHPILSLTNAYRWTHTCVSLSNLWLRLFKYYLMSPSLFFKQYDAFFTISVIFCNTYIILFRISIYEHPNCFYLY